MAKKTQFNLMFDSQIAASTTDLQLLPVIPLDKTAIVLGFGGSAAPSTTSSYALQWGNGSTWDTVYASYGNMNKNGKRVFKGNGVKRFRIVRINAEASPRVVIAWVEGYVNDA